MRYIYIYASIYIHTLFLDSLHDVLIYKCTSIIHFRDGSDNGWLKKSFLLPVCKEKSFLSIVTTLLSDVLLLLLLFTVYPCFQKYDIVKMLSRTVIIKIVTVGWKLLLHQLILTGTSTKILIKIY